MVEMESTAGENRFDLAKAEFFDFYSKNATILLRPASKSFRDLVRFLLEDNDLEGFKVTSRVKESKGCVEKFSEKYRALEEDKKGPYQINSRITDLIGVRVVCLYNSEVDKIYELIVDNFEKIESTNKTEELEKDPRQFGYRGRHLDVKLHSDRCDKPEYKKFKDLQFEIQIRTIAQDAWSEVDHKLQYKNEIPSDLKRRINRLAALFELVDQEFSEIHVATQKSLEEISADESHLHDSDQLGAFEFLALAQKAFAFYSFGGYKADQLVEQIQKARSGFTVGDFKKCLSSKRELVDKYRDYLLGNGEARVNPFTEIRHMLYAFEQDSFTALLFRDQKENFDKWLETQHTG